MMNSCYCNLILFSCIAYAITSSAFVDQTRTDGMPISNANSTFLEAAEGGGRKHSPLIVNQEFGAVLSAKTLSISMSEPSIPGEEGPITITSTAAPRSTPSPVPTISKDSEGTKNKLQARSKSPKAPKTDAQSKIIPSNGLNERGVDQSTKDMLLKHDPHSTKHSELPSRSEKAFISEEPMAPTINPAKHDVINTESNLGLGHSVNITFGDDSGPPGPVDDVKIIWATTKKHKAKPTVTIGEAEVDKPIPASPTKASPLGIPRKIDFIVPIVISIIALPLLGVVSYVVYRRGRDCWDKRHYRRMDFLIDGMYND